MSLKSRFLTLSMKEQIFFAIIVLTCFCILVVFAICCSLSYEFLRADYKQKKLYFFNKYKEYIESCSYFQNCLLLQYEEIIRRNQKQSWKYHQTIGIYNEFNFFDDYSDAIISYNDKRDKELGSSKTKNNLSALFVLCYTNEIVCSAINNYTLLAYQSLSNTIISHDIFNYFKIPGYNVPLMKTPIFTNVKFYSIISFNGTKIHQKLIEIQNGDTSYINDEKINIYFNKKVEDFISNEINMFKFYFLQELGFFRHMFNKTYNEIISEFQRNTINFYDEKELYNFAKAASGYLSTIDYGNNEISLISFGGKEDFYYCEASLIDNYLYFINKRIANYIDFIFIPLYFGNNTIISPELCFLFKLKQNEYQVDKNSINDLYNEIKKGNSTFESCFINNDLLNSEYDIKDLINLNFTTFLKVTNYFYKGISNLVNKKDKFPFFFMKYSYPNYNVLKDFQSEYLIINQVDFYLYTSFKDPIKYAKHAFQVSQNCFLLIIIIILYIWLVCLFFNLLIYSRVINDWTEPIIKLQEAIESSSITDENIFEYKNDDIINELFSTCKELLSGQIDNNEKKGLKNFNILSIPKDKQKLIDKNIYKKNLIINNDIMNNLIDQQQNMMDFSKNIQLNDPNFNNIDNKNQIKPKKAIKLNNKNVYLSRLSEENLISTISNSNLNKDTLDKNENNDNNIKNKTLEEIENEPYKKLFKVSEYLFYHRSKLDHNNILIIGKNNTINSTIDESKMSKIMSKNNKTINSSLKNFKNSIVRSDFGENNDNSENVHINMLDEENISYLWYIEAKKKNNKSFNYNLDDDYKELFVDFYDNYKYNHDINNKK